LEIIAILNKMDDITILQDKYFYIKQEAFKAIREIQESSITKAIKEDDDKAKENAEYRREQAGREFKSQYKRSKKRPVSRHIKCPVHLCNLITVDPETILIDYCPGGISVHDD